ncbi:MAG TPA: glycosyltransferase family 4 protein [Candidatus Limnocylindrales bacterium]|nr:glycosyltransferase family 4 protein [Candidatus Limnocylindrales bacterium]
MRFLLLNQYYPPDIAPTGNYLHDLARALIQSGHQVKVICSKRCYDGKGHHPAREIRDGVEIARLPSTAFGRIGTIGKIVDYASYYSALVYALGFADHRPDLILSLTTPPYLGLLGKLAAKRYACRHAHWIMDLYPDILSAHGIVREKRAVFRLLSKLTRFQLADAARVLTLGPTVADNLSSYTNHPVDWLPLWSDSELLPWPADQSNPLRKQRGWPANDVVFLYSGNMGRGHRFTEFFQAAEHLAGSGPLWVFSGGGKRRHELESTARAQPRARIEFLDYVPQQQLREHLCAGDVHLASLDSAWQGMMVPSKLQGSFAVGRPVLYVGGRDCEIASWILNAGGGWVVDQGDIKGLLRAVEQALNPSERRKRGRAARSFAQKHFNKQLCCDQILELLTRPRLQDLILKQEGLHESPSLCGKAI